LRRAVSNKKKVCLRSLHVEIQCMHICSCIIRRISFWYIISCDRAPSLVKIESCDLEYKLFSTSIIVAPKFQATIRHYVTLLPDMNIYNFIVLMRTVVFQICWLKCCVITWN